MNTRADTRDDGMIGLGVLALMVVAFVSGQAQGLDPVAGDYPIELRRTDSLLIQPDTLGPFEAVDEGSLRELRLMPHLLDSTPELGWSSDSELIEKYRKTGL